MLGRRRDDETVRTETVERSEHAWASPPVVRGLTTLLGVGVAGFLVWLASEFDLGSTGEYWAAMGILAGAGAVPRPLAAPRRLDEVGGADDQPRRLLPRLRPDARRGRGHPRGDAADRHGGGRAGRRLDPRHRPRRAGGEPRSRTRACWPSGWASCSRSRSTRAARACGRCEQDTTVVGRGRPRLPSTRRSPRRTRRWWCSALRSERAAVFPRARDGAAGGRPPIPRRPWMPHRLTISTAGAPAGSSGTAPSSSCSRTTRARAAARGWSGSWAATSPSSSWTRSPARSGARGVADLALRLAQSRLS